MHKIVQVLPLVGWVGVFNLTFLLEIFSGNNDIPMARIFFLLIISLNLAMFSTMLVTRIATAKWPNRKYWVECVTFYSTLYFFIGLLIESELIFGVVSKAIGPGIRSRNPILSAGFALAGLMLTVGGIGAVLQSIHVVSHPCNCRACREIRTVFTAESLLICAMIFVFAQSLSAYEYVGMATSIGIANCVSAVYFMVAIVCAAFIFGNRHKEESAATCTRVPNVISQRINDSATAP